MNQPEEQKESVESISSQTRSYRVHSDPDRMPRLVNLLTVVKHRGFINLVTNLLIKRFLTLNSSIIVLNALCDIYVVSDYVVKLNCRLSLTVRGLVCANYSRLRSRMNLLIKTLFRRNKIIFGIKSDYFWAIRTLFGQNPFSSCWEIRH